MASRRLEDQSDTGDTKDKGNPRFDIFQGPPRHVARVGTALETYLETVQTMHVAKANLLCRLVDMCPKHWKIIPELRIYLEDQSMLWSLAVSDLRPLFIRLKKYLALTQSASYTLGEFENRLKEVKTMETSYMMMKQSNKVSKNQRTQIEYMLRESKRALSIIRNSVEETLLTFRKSQTEMGKDLLHQFEGVQRTTCNESIQVIEMVEDRLNAVPVKKLNHGGQPIEDLEFVQNLVQNVIDRVESAPVNVSSKVLMYDRPGNQPVNQGSIISKGGQSRPYSPSQGRPYSPSQGQSANKNQGRPYSPGPGRPYSPGQGRPYSPGQGQSVNTSQGRPYSPGQGRPYSPCQGQSVNTSQGRPYSPGQGQPVNTRQGQPVNTSQGRPYSPGQGQSVNTSQGRVYSPSQVQYSGSQRSADRGQTQGPAAFHTHPYSGSDIINQDPLSRVSRPKIPPEEKDSFGSTSSLYSLDGQKQQKTYTSYTKFQINSAIPFSNSKTNSIRHVQAPSSASSTPSFSAQKTTGFAAYQGQGHEQRQRSSRASSRTSEEDESRGATRQHHQRKKQSSSAGASAKGFKTIECDRSLEDLYNFGKPIRMQERTTYRKSRPSYKTPFPLSSVEDPENGFYDCN